MNIKLAELLTNIARCPDCISTEAYQMYLEAMKSLTRNPQELMCFPLLVETLEYLGINYDI